MRGESFGNYYCPKCGKEHSTDAQLAGSLWGNVHWECTGCKRSSPAQDWKPVNLYVFQGPQFVERKSAP